ncbi:hypothetical protein FF38_00768 [Lucilia cuprina]|uniref:Uncharacterized protein n=1 Tax=Lucilia cuprina TaxID=7375 RepID=A0A0L0BTL0_LUCCU|nr:hypothetical protein FF38_00768 [Lucilia cuprina]
MYYGLVYSSISCSSVTSSISVSIWLSSSWSGCPFEKEYFDDYSSKKLGTFLPRLSFVPLDVTLQFYMYFPTDSTSTSRRSCLKHSCFKHDDRCGYSFHLHSIQDPLQ